MMLYKQCVTHVLDIKSFVTTNDKYRKVHRRWKFAFSVKKELTTEELTRHFRVIGFDEEHEEDLSSEDDE